MKKPYIQPALKQRQFMSHLMDNQTSFVQGGDNDPIVDDEGDILGKHRDHNTDRDRWGDLW